MCMAPPGGRPQGPPGDLLQRVCQRTGFGALLVRFVVARLAAWFGYRRTLNA